MLIMRGSAIQMDMKFADPAYNFKHAEELIREAAASKPDVIVLPEGESQGAERQGRCCCQGHVLRPGP